jgi:hypothetical protein
MTLSRPEEADRPERRGGEEERRRKGNKSSEKVSAVKEPSATYGKESEEGCRKY